MESIIEEITYDRVEINAATPSVTLGSVAAQARQIKAAIEAGTDEKKFERTKTRIEEEILDELRTEAMLSK